ncbi:hypothetical protein [Acinetobacter lwoffii]|uniref:hypothetical protein n=1 Tax=Acinetobacter lwoffii TaxID=28090 RepID=UPI00389161A7
MKKIIIFSLVACLLGCKEPQTELQKKVINTAYENCEEKLKATLKSPSSLRINNASASNYMPESQNIYNLYSKKILDDKTNKITTLYKDSKWRYRSLNVGLSYEAQNSFGVYLPGEFSCTYMYELRGEDESPEGLKLIQIKSSDEVADFNGLSISVDSASNYILNENIKNISSSVGSLFSESDKKTNADIEKLRLNEIKENSGQKNLKQMTVSELAALEADMIAAEAEAAAADATAILKSLEN